MRNPITILEDAFKHNFGVLPQVIVKAPGRVNIIGEHTDYNHGYVLPMALEQSIYIAGRTRSDSILNFTALNTQRTSIADINCPVRNPIEPWMDYIVGVVAELKKLGFTLKGVDGIIYGEVPIGCGLSSSAALEMATLKLFEMLNEFHLDDVESAKLGQRVENNFLGLKSGIMDQFISRCGKKDHALFIDCRTLNFELVPLKLSEHTFVISNTNYPRGLTDSKYNERVYECQKAVEILQKSSGKTGTYLRDFTLKDLENAKNDLEDTIYRRALHVITENQRVLDFLSALKNSNIEDLGILLNESDYSLQRNYEVTNRELEVITQIARSIEGCIGARMTGAGFGGCTINLVRKDCTEKFIDTLLSEYEKATGRKGSCIISSPSDGANIVKRY
ncbi:MAG: galactokinase [Candidatus Hydrogenedentes bacterium]|nr:galactokinase [Candidatus Hydrogenedentota bacterium]